MKERRERERERERVRREWVAHWTYGEELDVLHRMIAVKSLQIGHGSPALSRTLRRHRRGGGGRGRRFLDDRAKRTRNQRRRNRLLTNPWVGQAASSQQMGKVLRKLQVHYEIRLKGEGLVPSSWENPVHCIKQPTTASPIGLAPVWQYLLPNAEDAGPST